jgi:3-hydroxy-3-methylglutaryl CoA synthase
VDQEKPISTWVQRYVGLPSRARNIEVKHACYGATASIQLAASWIASGMARGQTALIINTGESRTHLGAPWDFVLGASATALLISDNPWVLEIEPEGSGVYTYEVSDLTCPTSQVETGNSETSLLSYLEALEGALDDFLRLHPEAANLDAYFQRNIYRPSAGWIRGPQGAAALSRHHRQAPDLGALRQQNAAIASFRPSPGGDVRFEHVHRTHGPDCDRQRPSRR